MIPNVRVAVRIRPLSPEQQSILSPSSDANSIKCLGVKGKQGNKEAIFTFDHVYGTDKTQQDLYNETAAPMLQNFLDGYNVTIMAYGQTGSGKTFTIGTADTDNAKDPSIQGILPRFIDDLFEHIKKQRLASTIEVSF